MEVFQIIKRFIVQHSYVPKLPIHCAVLLQFITEYTINYNVFRIRYRIKTFMKLVENISIS